MNQQNRDGEQDDSTHNSEPSSIVETDADNQKKATRRNARDADPEHKKSFRRSWRSASPLTKVTLFLTGIIAIATVLYMIFAGWQLYEIHSGAEDTHRLAQAAQDSANTTKEQLKAMQGQLNAIQDQASTMRGQANTMSDTLAETRKMVKSAETQANTSQALARAAEVQANTSQITARAAESSARFAGQTIEATREATLTTNRAYLTASQILPPELSANGNSSVTVDWDNDGSSPARIIGGQISFMFSPHIPKWAECVPSGRQIKGITVQPRSTRTQRYSATSEVVQNRIAAVESGRQIFTICGNVSYDTLGHTYPYEFCAYWNKEKQEYLNCEEGDEK
jgi:hypothetical protein